ncbi:tRNA threonylcarbamoyladenosine dehydratase [Soehngenia saccharolytica]|nr:tRNA threonylcarbamoyladenosine dehydratase [Soehngenia saccharolytica]
MSNPFERTISMIGDHNFKKIQDSNVIIFGIGGVGSYSAESLVRAGLGNITLVDYDIIDITNINRQVHATTKTIGLPKVSVMKDRLLEINPSLNIEIYQDKVSADNIDFFELNKYNYIIDAIDMISSKICLIEKAKTLGINIISAMGAGNKLDPTRFKVDDIFNTKVCPLAKTMRQELKKKNIDELKVVYSDEMPLKVNLGDNDKRKAIPGSMSYVPPVVGMIITSEVIKDIMNS